jgi:uncharacterized protein YbjT (DUF2867 family)
MKVIVLGATGTVGSQVVRELHARGVQVRALTRDPHKAEKLPADTEVVRGDLLDPGTVSTVFSGMDAAFLLNGVGTTECHEGLMAVNGARLGSVQRIVYLSVAQAERAPHLPHFGAKLPIEAAIRASGIPFTILRPNNFFQNDYWYEEALLKYGVYPQPIGQRGVSRVDVRDIAEAAAIALTGPGHEGQIYELGGPDVLSGPGTAEIWGRALGRTVAYAGDDMDAWQRQAMQYLPAWMAFDFRLMYEHFHRTGLEISQEDLARLTALLGHAPRTFEAFAKETAEAWRRRPSS